MRRITLVLFSSLLVVLLLAPTAFADQLSGGVGTYGETDDKVVTYAGFILIAFFPLLVLVLTLIQSKLDKRKDERLAAEKRRREQQEWYGGW